MDNLLSLSILVEDMIYLFYFGAEVIYILARDDVFLLGSYFILLTSHTFTFLLWSIDFITGTPCMI